MSSHCSESLSFEKKNLKLSCENWGISTWQGTFYALEKKWKKEITLDPSKSLENVQVREIQSSKK